MAFKLQNQSFSFLRGPDRVVEEKLWDVYSHLWGKTIPQGNAPYKMQSMLFYKRVDVVLATLLEIIGICHLTRPLPYPLHAPENLLTWPSQNPGNTPIASGSEFFYSLLGMYGIIPDSISAPSLLVIVDPQLLETKVQQDLVKMLGANKQPSLIVVPPNTSLPTQLNPLLISGQLTTYVTDSPSPLITPEIDELIAGRGISTMSFAGSGNRLLPAIVAGIDILLDLYDHAGHMSYEDRRTIAGQLVTVVSRAAQFDTSWYHRETLLSQALSAYLTNLGVDTTPVTGSYDLNGGFATKPLLVPKT